MARHDLADLPMHTGVRRTRQPWHRAPWLIALISAALVLSLVEAPRTSATTVTRAGTQATTKSATIASGRAPTADRPKSAPHTAAHAAASGPAPAPPGGGSPGLPVSGGWQDGDARLVTLDLHATPTLTEFSLYRLVRNDALFWEVTGSTIAGTRSSTGFVTFSASARSGTTTRFATISWDPAGNAGAGQISISDGSASLSPVRSAAFVYDGAVTKLGVVSNDGRFLLLPARATLSVTGATVAGATVPANVAALFGAYLGYQNTPPDLTVLQTVPSGFTIDAAAMAKVFQFPATATASSSAATPTSTCLAPCFSISAGGQVRGSLSVTADLITFTPTGGTNEQIKTAALSYPIPAAPPTSTTPPVTAHVSVAIAGVAYALPTSDPAGAALIWSVYSPLRDVRNVDLVPDGDPTAYGPPAPPITDVSTVEYDYFVTQGGNNPADYRVADAYSDSELDARPQALVPVNLADPLTQLDDGATNYQFRDPARPLGSADSYLTTNRSADTAPGVTVIAQGFARVYGSAFWQPVLAVQSGIARSSIKLLQLADRGNAPAFARAISGRLTRTLPLSSIAPLERDGATMFTDRNPASAMVNPSSLLQISGGQVVLVGPAISAAGSGDSPWVTLPAGQSAPVTSVGYGTLEQSGGAGRTKVLAVQAGAYVYLLSVTGGLTPAMTTALSSLFTPLTDRASALSKLRDSAIADLVATYALAVGHGLDQTRTDLTGAIQARAIEQSGHVFPFASGATRLTPTLAKQFFDPAAVDKVLLEAQQNTDVLRDESAAWAMTATIDEEFTNPSATGTAVSGGIWGRYVLPSMLTAYPALKPSVTSTTGGTALASDIKMAGAVVSWIVQEAATNTSSDVLTLPPLGQDYPTLLDRVSAAFPMTGTSEQNTAEWRLALANAYELLGISNRQIILLNQGMNGDTTACGSRDQCRNAYGQAFWARAALQPDIAHFSWTATSTEPFDLAYLRARVVGMVTPSSLGSTPPANLQMAGLGRSTLRDSQLAPSENLAARTAQFVSRAAFADFAAWSDGIADSADLNSRVSDARRLALTMLHNLDGPLAEAMTSNGIHDAMGAQFFDVRLGDLTDDQLTKAVHATIGAWIQFFRAWVRDVGFGVATYLARDEIKQALTVLPLSMLVANLKALFQDKSALSVFDKATMSSLWMTALDRTDHNLVVKLNQAGVYGTLTALFAVSVISARFAEGATLTTTDQVLIALSFVQLFVVLEHYPRLYAVYRTVWKGENFRDAIDASYRYFGTALDMQKLGFWLFKDDKYRVNETTKLLFQRLAVKIQSEPAATLSTAEVRSTLTELGWSFNDDDDTLNKVSAAMSQIHLDTSSPDSASRTQSEIEQTLVDSDEEMSSIERVNETVQNDTELSGEIAKAGDDAAAIEKALLSRVQADGETVEVFSRLLDKNLDSTTSSLHSVAVASERTTKELLIGGDSSTELIAEQAARTAFATGMDADKQSSDPERPSTLYGQVEDHLNEGATRARLKQQQPWSPVGRATLFIIIGINVLADITNAFLTLALAILFMHELMDTPLGRVVVGFEFAGATALIMASLVEISGTLLALGVAMPLFFLGVLLLAIAMVLSIFVKRNPARDNDALTEWAKPFLASGVIAGGNEGVAALLWWHAHKPAFTPQSPGELSVQTFPSRCRPGGDSCRRPVEIPGPDSTRYLLKQVGGTQCLAIPRATVDAFGYSQGNPAQLGACDYTRADRAFYVMRDVGAETAHLVLPYQGCLDNKDASTTLGNPLISWSCDVGDQASAWILEPTGSAGGAVLLRNQGSGRCAGSQDAVTAAGTAVVQVSCSASAGTQQWLLIPAPLPSYLLKQSGSGYCAAISYAATANNAVLADCAPAPDRVFRRLPWPTGTMRLALDNDVCLDLYSDSTVNGAPIKGWTCDSSDVAQYFTATTGGLVGGLDGALTIRTHQGKCLDTANAGTGKYAQIVHGTCTGSATQTWTLVPVGPQQLATLRPTTATLCTAVNWANAGQFSLLAGCDDAYSDRTFYVQPNADGSSRFMLPNNLCLTATATTGTPVNGETCAANGDAKQAWQLTAGGDGSGTYTNVYYGTCLDLAGAVTTYQRLVTRGCASVSTQQWRVVKFGAAPQTIKQSGSGGYCAAVAWAARGGNALLAPCTSDADRTFYTIPTADGFGANLVLGNGLCLAVAGVQSGTPVTGEYCSDRVLNGEWQLVKQSDGTTVLKSGVGLCLDSWNGGTGVLTNLVVGACTNSSTQKWTLADP